MRRGAAVLLGAALALPALAGCGTDAPSSRTTSAPVPTTPTVTATATATAPMDDADTDAAGTSDTTPEPDTGVPRFPAGTGRQTRRSAGAQDLVLTDVRAAAHDGFDRVVLELSGTGRPGWTVGYVDDAVMDGSGEAVDLDGDTVLDVYASGTTWPGDDYYDGPRHVRPAGGGGDLADVYVVGTFEGNTQVLTGIDGERAPFRVFTLTDPPRLIVDVATGG